MPAGVGQYEERTTAMKGGRPKSKVVEARLSVGLMEVYISNLEKIIFVNLDRSVRE